MPPDMKTPNNSEIDQALKEFEAQSGAGAVPKSPEALKTSDVPRTAPSGISFETDTYRSENIDDQVPVSKMVKLVIKWSGGAIKEQRQAEYVLLAFSVVVFLFSLYLFFGQSSSKPKNPESSFEQILRSRSGLAK